MSLGQFYMGEKSVWGGVVEGKFRLWIWISNCSLRMKVPRARAHESLTRTGEKPKNSTTKGAGGVPQIWTWTWPKLNNILSSGYSTLVMN